MSEETKKKKCFVVMGFGEKTDYATKRVLNLDKTYRIIIKKAVEDAGLECIRADDVIHSGLIDRPMYELLLDADLVVADLSTSNANALYELGVRHALKPYTTIVIAEKKFKFPFDIKSLLIRTYEHMGKGIDAEEAETFRTELTKTIKVLMDAPKIDSPVHEFLPQLLNAIKGASETKAEPERAAVASAANDQSASELMEMFVDAKTDEAWTTAGKLLEKLLKMRPSDEYLIQQRALVTYKGKKPDAVTALLKAQEILQELDPQTTGDPETLGLWGAIHKRLWELKKEQGDLETSIWAYERGFYLKEDYYNGINYAFLLNVRAALSTPREAVADFVSAERIRRRVITICHKIVESEMAKGPGKFNEEEMFWLLGTLVEAYAGIGETKKADEVRAAAEAKAPVTWLFDAVLSVPPAGWMIDTMNDQVGKLAPLLANPPAI
jgi:tetratricopeptide (TPR) repeat protein